MTTMDPNDPKNTDTAKRNDKSQKTDITRSNGVNPRNGKLISDILSGEYRFIIGIFRGKLRNGHFSCIRSLSEFEIGQFEQELCHEVHISIWKKVRDHEADKIRSVPAFVDAIIWNRCLDENDRCKERRQLISL